MTNSELYFNGFSLTRRHLLGAMGLAAVSIAAPANAFAQAAPDGSAVAPAAPDGSAATQTAARGSTAGGSAAAQAIADHFSGVATMQGEFVQFGPRGEQTGGKFYIQRPGKLRFNYDNPSPIRVISDGRNVAVGNLKLKTWSLYPLSKTPLSLLLARRIDLSDGSVKSVKEESDLTTIALGNRTIFGSSTITMMFDPKTYDLRQWTITDNQGKNTSVMVFNVKTGAQFDDKVFRVPYESIQGTAASRD
ncbi:outer membrane lipoprotein carrier protein LolA [Rhizobium sp. P32RR-XVIII]|uniref:outer membrane lipoprotein carrier protein LolA n=1 Tax=Rhizobium sp. P32RR-XVIII TaxID=2726738 RepID=UPI0014572D77|nr:outer membrane lipoprotein carrier protein LolA [Rhizobium sp. P32RR-XVIII]NLS05723.1 outer membrane lipoprotein carrier protein LolA [Rhizobium sp. P32RR-XVIII]